ncbi:TRAP transporter substrate-binding protein [Salipiger abyssi]|uniref:TRAP transporter substrate-binding protein n=1 Tax=Salipiger abyssi TaxID=1250539 RepID=UPI0040596643
MTKYTKIGLAAAASAAALIAAGGATAQDTTKLRMHTAFPTQTPVIGEITPWIAERIEKLTGGTLEVDVFEPGALVPSTDYFDAVSQGAVDMAFGTPGYGAGLEPAMTIFTAVPFGPQATEFMAWMRYGGGQELHDELLADLNLKGFVCTLGTPETSGWMKREINSPDDLSGMKLRYFGLGGRVLDKLGASIQLIPGSEVYAALERGVIDGGEYASPSVDLSAGLEQVVDYVYFPGWHQQVSIDTLIINLDTWNGLSEQQQLAIETTCGEATLRTLAQGAAAQPAAVQSLMDDENGPEVREWSDEILAQLRTAWDEVAEEESAKHESFARVMESYNSFRASYSDWQSLGYLKPEEN